MNAAGGQIQGARKRQEDAWHLVEYGEGEVLALLADGLGGHPAGDVASREAVRDFAQQFAAKRDEPGADPRTGPRQWLQEATLEADRMLRALAVKKPLYRGMATTLVALYVRGDKFWAASVGDSYLLLLRDGRLMRLNELHAEGGGVTSCVGYNLSRVDIADTLPAAPGDRFLLASDGVIVLEDEEVTRFLGDAADAPAAVKRLLDAVEEARNPGQDNTTVVAVLL